MRTIETMAPIELDGKLTLKLPPDIKPGQRHVVLVIDQVTPESTERAAVEPFPILQVATWGDSADETFRREDVYGNDGH